MCESKADYRFGVACSEDFTPLSNFTLDYVYEVRAGADSGFPVECDCSVERSKGKVVLIILFRISLIGSFTSMCRDTNVTHNWVSYLQVFSGDL